MTRVLWRDGQDIFFKPPNSLSRESNRELSHLNDSNSEPNLGKGILKITPTARQSSTAVATAEMVFIVVKKSPTQQFIFETSHTEEVGSLVRQLVNVHNSRLRIERLQQECEELAKHGPSKEPSKQGLTDELSGLSLEDDDYKSGASTSSQSQNFNPDPSGKRTGEAPDPRAAETLRQTIQQAAALLLPDRVDRKECTTEAELDEALKNIAAAVMICFPMGLPEYDPVRANLDYKEDLAGMQAGLDVLDPSATDLWWAGKQLMMSHKLEKYTGKNEKTKIIAKLQKAGQGAPAREPLVDANTQKNMVAWYRKKEEQTKGDIEQKLAENDDDDYTNSAWANPKLLKNQVNGLSRIIYR